MLSPYKNGNFLISNIFRLEYSCIFRQTQIQSLKKLSYLLVIAMLASCGNQNINIDSEKESIIKCWNDWEAKGKAGDPAYYWSDDVIIMGQGQPTIKGKAAFNKLFSEMQKMPGFKMVWDKKPSILEISKDGQMAYLLARNELTITDSTGKINSFFNQALQIWKKDQEGNWKTSVSVMYPDIPPAMPH
jgi:ketosteroid isomerase-like protein